MHGCTTTVFETCLGSLSLAEIGEHDAGHDADLHGAAGERPGAHRDAERLGLQPGRGRVEGRHRAHCWQACGPPDSLGHGACLAWRHWSSGMEGWEGIPSLSACKDLHSLTLKGHPLCYRDMSQCLPALALTRAHSEDRCTASTGSSTHSACNWGYPQAMSPCTTGHHADRFKAHMCQDGYTCMCT